jgi:hypothetical protein
VAHFSPTQNRRKRKPEINKVSASHQLLWLGQRAKNLSRAVNGSVFVENDNNETVRPLLVSYIVGILPTLDGNEMSDLKHRSFLCLKRFLRRRYFGVRILGNI